MHLLRTAIGLASIGIFILAAPSTAQQAGTQVPEEHPSLPSQVCTTAVNVLEQAKVVKCVTENSSVVIDVNRRRITAVGSGELCYDGGKWNSAACLTPEECGKVCALQGALYKTNHSIITTGDELTLNLKTRVWNGSRVYMLDDSGKKYKQFQLLNQEFTFDVDMSTLPCGSNGALYFVKMDADGGSSRFPANTAGAAYGTGYCDAQCQHGVRFINGESNPDNMYGSCCAEMDIWEANSMSTAYTTHPCSVDGQQRCLDAKDCGSTKETHFSGWCDMDGCDFNPFRMGAQSFYGPGKKYDIDTTRPFSVITQFVTDDNTDTGELVEIRRLYKQDDRVVDNAKSTWKPLNGTNSISDKMCNATKSFFEEHPYVMGGLAQLGKDMVGGMTLVMSVWADSGSNMTWLDSYSKGDDLTKPGKLRGRCPNPGGSPDDIFAESPNAAVKFMNIRSGDFGSTY